MADQDEASIAEAREGLGEMLRQAGLSLRHLGAFATLLASAVGDSYLLTLFSDRGAVFYTALVLAVGFVAAAGILMTQFLALMTIWARETILLEWNRSQDRLRWEKRRAQARVALPLAASVADGEAALSLDSEADD